VLGVECYAMRPKARGLAQHGGDPPSWLEDSGEWPSMCDFVREWTGHTACLFHAVPVALTGAAQLRTYETSSCCYIVNVHNHPS
jgi:hypothetical protein